jgi:hypothetical protein
MTELKWRNYPVEGMPGNITGGFGSDYGYEHRGTDVGIVTGTPVRAPGEGRIVPMTNDGSFGIAVCIEHPGTGWYSAYCHLSRADVSIGDWVDAGDLLGLSGNTGYSSGPHLHWQVCDSTTFPTNIAHSRDPMAVPFETGIPELPPEDDEMSDDERELLLNVASIVGGWSNGAAFTTVPEALTQMRQFEATDQRVLIGMGLLNGSLNTVIASLTAHMSSGHNKSADYAAIAAALDKAAEEIAGIGTTAEASAPEGATANRHNE